MTNPRVAELTRLYHYGYWANSRLFRVLEQVGAEQFTRTVAGSYGSLRNTLVHTLSAEWGWLERCGGPARGPKLKPSDYPDLASVQETWRKVEALMRGFLAGLSDPDLDRGVEFSLDGTTRHTVPLGDLLRHGAIHGVHHRGQAALLLRMLGHPPGDFDLLFFCTGPRDGSP